MRHVEIQDLEKRCLKDIILNEHRYFDLEGDKHVEGNQEVEEVVARNPRSTICFKKKLKKKIKNNLFRANCSNCRLKILKMR